MLDLARWERQSLDLASTRPMLAAFAGFADLEDEFEPLENRVVEHVLKLDEAINFEVDRFLGK